MRSKRPQSPWPRPSRRSSHWQDHYRVAQDMLQFTSSRVGTSLLVWTLVGIALALPASLMLTQANLSRLAADWGGRPGISVYFELGAKDAPLLAMRLDQLPEVESVALTGQDEALREFLQHTNLHDALADLQTNPLPASLRVTVATSVTAEQLDGMSARLRKENGVAEVVVERTWLTRINAASRLAQRLGLVLGVLFGVGTVLITATTVRLAIEAQLDELKVMKLVGASDGQIRRPFLYFGAFYGVGGGLFAAMLLSVGLLALETPLRGLLGSFDETLELRGFDTLFVLQLLAIGGALGVAGAVLAVRQRLSRLDVL